MEPPPQSTFSNIDKSYDSSILLYFEILKWNIYLMLFMGLIQLPNLIFCLQGNIVFGSIQMQAEILSAANIDLSETNFLITVICDTIGCLVYLLSIYYLRYKRAEVQECKIQSISPWSVEMSGFPTATIDPDDLRSIVTQQIHEIYLARNFQGTLNIMKQKAHLERSIRIETKKLELTSQKLNQAEIYIRQDYIRILREDLKLKTQELSEKFNLFLAPDDLESVRAFVIFKNREDRDKFLEQYNPDFLVKSDCLCLYNQPTELQLRGLYTIRVKDAPDPFEIRWENMDFIETRKKQFILIQILVVLAIFVPLIIFKILWAGYPKQDPLICNSETTKESDCIDSNMDLTRFGIIIVTAAWIIYGDEIAMKLLNYVLDRERQIYLVQEQFSILWRLFLFLFLNAFAIPYVMSFKVVAQYLQFVSTSKDLVYSDNIDRKFILNHGILYFWMSIIYLLPNLFMLIGTTCVDTSKLSDQELQMIGGIITSENSEEERQMINTDQNVNQSTSNATAFLINVKENDNKESHINIDYQNAKPIRRDNQIINTNPTFQTGQRYARMLFCISLGILYSSQVPILPLISVLHMSLQYYNDKFLLLNYHSYNERQQVKLQQQLKRLGIKTLQFIPFLILLHMLMSIFVYGYPGFYKQNSLGMGMDWNSNQETVYKFSSVIPLTVLAGITLVAIILDFFIQFEPKNDVESQVFENISNNIDDHLKPLKEQGSMISYNLKYHDEYREIIISQKHESIRATLNQFKH
ncbi:hypothetical protein pb186bvf_014996 [Paramecium bursaria]